jgi:acetyltransferase-like isoleucine patch superfamily enzyme
LENRFLWWLRGLWYLRYPELVRSLGALKDECARIETIRNAYKGKSVRIHLDTLFQEWTPDRLKLGQAVAIEKGTTFTWAKDTGGLGFVEIGEHTWIGPYNNFRTAGSGRIVIGRKCYISQFCSFISNNHGIDRTTLIQDQPHDFMKTDVVVGDDAWFGVGCSLLPGTRIGTGAVLGAGSVVTKSIPAYEIWAGVPARKLGERV